MTDQDRPSLPAPGVLAGALVLSAALLGTALAAQAPAGPPGAPRVPTTATAPTGDVDPSGGPDRPLAELPVVRRAAALLDRGVEPAR